MKTPKIGLESVVCVAYFSMITVVISCLFLSGCTKVETFTDPQTKQVTTKTVDNTCKVIRITTATSSTALCAMRCYWNGGAYAGSTDSILPVDCSWYCQQLYFE